jgi:uncharacterized peroxidase-related enzyme
MGYCLEAQPFAVVQSQTTIIHDSVKEEVLRMSRIPLLETADQKETLEVFKDIEATFGRVPNLFRAYALYPPLLAANWNKKAIMLRQGSLSPRVKETIALLVSQDNGCAYCIAAHTTGLKSLGLSEAAIKSIEENLDATEFSPKEKALITLARQANRAPLQISDEAFAHLRRVGASDEEIIETLGVMELYTSFNKFLDALHIDIDF